MATALPAFAQPFEQIVSLNSNAFSDTHDDGAVALASDGKGRWMAVWETLNNFGGHPAMHDWDIIVASSRDEGRTWSPARPLAESALRDHALDNSPAIATDGTGTWVAAWQSRDLRGGKIGPDSDILWSRSTDDGATWSEPVPVAEYALRDTGQDFHPEVLAVGGGAWLIAWESFEPVEGTGRDSDLLVARSSDNAETWSAPRPLNANATSDRDTDRQVTLASDRGGKKILAGWEAYSSLGGTIGMDWDVLIADSSDGGQTWSQPRPLAPSRAGSDGFAGDESLSLATSGNGRWMAVWTAYVGKVGDEEDDWDILTASSKDGGQTWSDPVSLNGPFKTDTHRDLQPRIVHDGAGRWVALWYSKDSMGKTKGSDSDLLVSVSTDDGKTWSHSQFLAAYATRDGKSWDDRAVLATDGRGMVLAAWAGSFNIDGKTGSDGDIRVVAMPKDTRPAPWNPAPPAAAASGGASAPTAVVPSPTPAARVSP
ncbi:MAG TPA: sialidase family protein [Candidatus Binatia bacterium]|nr:sialidase family protein [Candidatus Binatia bacterium]